MRYESVADLPRWQVNGYTSLQQEAFFAEFNRVREEGGNVTEAFNTAHRAAKEQEAQRARTDLLSTL